MSAGSIQKLTSRLRRSVGWKSRILVLLCLGLGACVTSWSGLGKSPPDQRAYASPGRPAPSPRAMDFIQGFGSNVELEGTSTLGPWKSRSTDIHGQVTLYTDEAQLEGVFDRLETATPNDEVGASTPWLALAVRAAPIADISVPVISLHGGSSGMDQDMQKALNAAQHPLIEYVFENLQQATVQHDPQNHEAELKLSIVGTIHMAGAERPATMDVIVRRDSRRHFLAHSQVKMLMSDFGVTPPGALFGLIRGGEQVTVTFNLDLALTHDSFAKEQSTRPDRAN